MVLKPKKITISNGKRVLSDYDSRTDEYKEYNRNRWRYSKSSQQFYNSTIWRNTSKRVLLRDDYVCQMCGGEATMVDHIIPLKRDWMKRLDLTNLQASCKRCNDSKARREK